MKRPALDKITSGSELNRWYWLKNELLIYCRSKGLRVSGNKPELQKRIESFLDDGVADSGKVTAAKGRRKKTSTFDWHSADLSLETVITDSYKNTQNVRRFLISEIGDKFRFSIPLMKWIKENEGKTLNDVITRWKQLQEEQSKESYESYIPPSNEYNQYVRDFMKDNKASSLSEARQCWLYKKSLPGSNKYCKTDLKKPGI